MANGYVKFKMETEFSVCPQDYHTRELAFAELGRAIDLLDKQYGGIVVDISTEVTSYNTAAHNSPEEYITFMITNIKAKVRSYGVTHVYNDIVVTEE